MENIQNIQNIEIEKSPNDPNLYRYVSLSNGIKAFLISNPYASSQIPNFDSNETQKLSKKSTFQQSKEYSKANVPDLKSKHKTEKKPIIEEVSDQEIEKEGQDEEEMDEEFPEEEIKSFLKQNQENLLENQEKINNISQGVSSIVVLIETGSSNEPKKFHGLAHLLEHVIFLGCKEFPEQDSFSQFISNHGGSDNGRTSLDYTFFDFSIENEFLFEALYRFSRLLKEPLFPEDGIEKELKAVNNEFELSQTSDGSRNFQILLDSSHPDSKYNSFSWGSLESLSQGAKVLRQEIIEFFEKYYISNKIKICIYSKIGLDELQGYVEKSFGDLNINNKLIVGKHNNNENANNNSRKEIDDLHRSYYSGMFYVETVKNEHLLIISWALKPFLHHYRSRSVQPIISVLNDEGPNSLCSYLKKADLINSIYSYVDDDDGLNSLFMLFTIEVDLTQKGIENWCEIIYEVFKYIDLIKQKPGIPEYYFEELKILAEKKFLFDDEENPESMVEKLAFLLTFVEPKELILAYSGLFLEKNTAFFEEILEQLRIDNVRITFMSTKESFPKRINLNLEEKWFHTKFFKENTADFLLPSLKTITHSTSDYKFPLENPFLPKNLEVLKCLNENDTDPRVIFSNHGEKSINNNNNDEIYPKIKCWHLFDIKELKPKICIEIIILFKFINENIEDQVNLEFFIEYFSEKFNEIIGYQSSEAEICFEVSLFEGKGINFSVYGYFDKMEVFLEKTFNLYTNICLSSIENKLFYQIKNRLLKDLKNYCLDLESQLQEAINNFIFPDYFLPEDYENYLNKYQINEFQDFCNKNFQSFENFFSITSYFHGNLHKDMALTLLSKITFILKEQLNLKKDLSKGLITKDFICKKMLALPSKNPNWKNKIVTIAKNEENKNFLVVKYIDFGKYDIVERNKLTVLLSILSPQTHEFLRMKKQIGYLANATLIDVRNKLGIMIIVNSSERNFDEIDLEINNFIKYFIDDFLKFQFSEMEFNNIVNGIIAKKLEVLRDMKLNCSRVWGEIVLNELLFDRTKKNIEILKGFQLKEIKAWIKAKFDDPKKMFILGVIPKNSDFNKEEDLQEILKDNRARYYHDFDMDLFNYEFF